MSTPCDTIILSIPPPRGKRVGGERGRSATSWYRTQVQRLAGTEQGEERLQFTITIPTSR